MEIFPTIYLTHIMQKALKLVSNKIENIAAFDQLLLNNPYFQFWKSNISAYMQLFVNEKYSANK